MPSAYASLIDGYRAASVRPIRLPEPPREDSRPTSVRTRSEDRDRATLLSALSLRGQSAALNSSKVTYNRYGLAQLPTDFYSSLSAAGLNSVNTPSLSGTIDNDDLRAMLVPSRGATGSSFFDQWA